MTQGVTTEKTASASQVGSALPFVSVVPAGEVMDGSAFDQLLSLLMNSPGSDAGTAPACEDRAVPLPTAKDEAAPQDDLVRLAAIWCLPLPCGTPVLNPLQAPISSLAPVQADHPVVASAPTPAVASSIQQTLLMPLATTTELAQEGPPTERVDLQQTQEIIPAVDGFVLRGDVALPAQSEQLEAVQQRAAGQPEPSLPASDLPSPQALLETGTRTSGDPTPVAAAPHRASGLLSTAPEAGAPDMVVLSQTLAPTPRTSDGALFADTDTQRDGREPAPKGAVRSSMKRHSVAQVEGTPGSSTDWGMQHAMPTDGVSSLHRSLWASDKPVRDVPPTEVVRQVVREIDAMVQRGQTTSVSLQLEPEHLGKLRVTISLSDGAIHAHIVADNHGVRQMLESNSSLLQQALQEHGLNLGALQVSVQGEGRHFGLNHQPYMPPQPGRGWLEPGERSGGETDFISAPAGGINLLA